ncbi:Imidazoleglycerol-phosphate dehydratase [Candidatus Nitrosacidococcus tergens]|uniref:Imidazoleglycerol-phosphate dehydratase n=1 Tax=Candidatus Nitrosacidococcus tergens TaxID=553981 RepID=A0A7G1QC04_9GAMM|nr:Imidazoleglycerol-phosphate dehydratase [Candidatus Nitrosacidococcus tergens]
MNRSVKIRRETSETQIEIALNLLGKGDFSAKTDIPFLDHMLNQIAQHGLIDLDINASGDLHIDYHHSVEDIGITLGQALKQAIGDKVGIQRYGYAYVPLDEALSRVVLDFSGRPGLHYRVLYSQHYINNFDVDLIQEFFQGLVNHAAITLHIDNLQGRNTHHIVETIFKAFGRALRMAVEQDPRRGSILPSTKGSL